MINESTRQKLIEKILNSQEFASSSIYGNYLSYLIKSSIENKSLKETTIAIEFFEKDSKFNPAEDTIVRSHTYKLRKKLERYYFTEGKDEKYRIRIPKGHYRVNIVQVSDKLYQPTNILKWITKQYQLAIIFFLIIALFLFWFSNQSLQNQLGNYQIIDKDNFIWKEYLQSELPVLIVPGDHFMFNAYIKKYNRNMAIRDFKTNSLKEMEALKIKTSDPSITPEPESYFPYHSIWSLPSLFSILYSVNQNPILRSSSSINPQMLDEYNIIFVGSIKTLYTLKHTIEKSHFKFGISPHKVTFTPPDSGDVLEFSTPTHSTGPNEDLVLVLKLPGPKDNSIMIIASYHSLGAPEIVNYFTKKETHSELKDIFNERIGRTPQYFEILFKVVGIDKTAYSRDILVLNEIKEN
ncbi:MAG: hypothetical protein D8M58_05095 [Calditrichaeota bacterium]|nr:MAG: hypothetical protein DWQ03_01980 [Calditrichota bacterium]MBL1204750.1 hypothetical protein [Calditrichota bacterium]NOG44578.1 hypothetical protein [Calditrichota bacterium]